MIDRSVLDDTVTLICDESGCLVEQVYDPSQLDRSVNPDETSLDVVLAHAHNDGWVHRQRDPDCPQFIDSCPAHRTR